jgi:hypothetical protein
VGEGTAGVSKPEAEIEREIDVVRRRLDKSLAELDRRRHELMDVKLQVSRHPQAVLIAGGAVVLLMGSIWLAGRRSSRPLPVRKERRRFVVQTRPRSRLWEKLAAAVGTTAAAVLAKRLLDRALSAR